MEYSTVEVSHKEYVNPSSWLPLAAGVSFTQSLWEKCKYFDFSGSLHMVPGLPAVCPPARQVLAAHHEPAARARIPAKYRLQTNHQEGRRSGQGPGTLFSDVMSFRLLLDKIFLKLLSEVSLYSKISC